MTLEKGNGKFMNFAFVAKGQHSSLKQPTLPPSRF